MKQAVTLNERTSEPIEYPIQNAIAIAAEIGLKINDPLQHDDPAVVTFTSGWKELDVYKCNPDNKRFSIFGTPGENRIVRKTVTLR